MRGYRGIPIERSELLKVLDSYSVCVYHKGEKLGVLTKDCPELAPEFLVDVIYYPGRHISGNKFHSDFLKIAYRLDQASSISYEVWWSIDKKRFVDSAPPPRQFRYIEEVHDSPILRGVNLEQSFL